MKITARFFLAALLFALVLNASFSSAEPGKKHEYLMYVGTYTDPGTGSKGIYAYRYNADSHELTPLGVAAETVNPSFVAAASSGKYLYAVNEIQNYQGQKSGGVSAFSIDHASGKLTFLNEVASRGADPCYITLDRSGKYVLVANYTGGNIATFPVHEDGRLGDAAAFVQHTGHGPNPERQEGPHAHSIDLTPDNRFALVDDLGLDQLLVYRFDAAKGALTPNNPPFAKLPPGAGPRHFALHPNGKFGYVVNEVQSSVTALRFDAKKGAFESLQTITTVPKDYKGHNDDAEVVIHKSGKWLYASNRGHDSLAVFAIDPAKGTLTWIQDVPTGGKTPRNFEIDPRGQMLFAANQESNNIVVFRIDENTGHLSATGKVLEVPAPVCIRFVQLD